MITKALVAAGVLIACLAWDTDSLAVEPTPILEFGWQLPCEVRVQETTTKRQLVVEVEYLIAIRRQSDSSDLYTVTRQGFRLLKVNGMDAQHPELRNQLAQFEATLANLPEFYIDRSGVIVGIEDWDRYLARAEPMIRDTFQSVGTDDAMVEQVLAMMRDPSARPAMEEKATAFWNLWVGNWVGLSASTDEQYAFPAELPLLIGDSVAVDFTVTTSRADEDCDGCIRISCEGSLGGDELVEAVRPGLERLQQNMEGAQPMDWDLMRGATAVQNSWVILNPNTMRPMEAYAEQGMKDLVVNGVTQTAEIRHYTFRWD